MNKLLTIVVPVYNTEKYLNKCLSSLVAERYMDLLEILVIIDGSPDDSISIARKYEDKYPSTFIVIEKENGGHGSCCNIGLKRAQGKYIRFLDSDDWFDEDDYVPYLELLTRVDADLIQTNLVRDYLSTGKSVKSDLYRQLSGRLIDAAEFDFTQFKYFLTIHNSTFKTEVLRKSGIVFTEKAPYDDTVLYLKPLAYIQTLYCSDLCVYHYLLDRPGQSVGSYNDKKVSAQFNEFKKLCDDYSLIRDTEMSDNKLKYADKFVNEVIIDGFYGLLFYSPSKAARNYLKQWYEYEEKLPFVLKKFPSWHKIYHIFGYDIARLIYRLHLLLKRVLVSL